MKKNTESKHTLIRGTVKLKGSTVLFVKRNALANSTVVTSQ